MFFFHLRQLKQAARAHEDAVGDGEDLCKLARQLRREAEEVAECWGENVRWGELVHPNADTAGIVIKSRATSDSIWRQPGAIVWTKLIPAGNLVSSHRPTSDMYPPQLCGGSQALGG